LAAQIARCVSEENDRSTDQKSAQSDALKGNLDFIVNALEDAGSG